MVDDWKLKLPEFVAGYGTKDIYNMDETVLFYRALPDNSLNIKNETCPGSKKSKEHITVSMCVNMEEDTTGGESNNCQATPKIKTLNVSSLKVFLFGQRHGRHVTTCVSY